MMIEVYDDLIPQELQDRIEKIVKNEIEGVKFLWEFVNNITNPILNRKEIHKYGFAHNLRNRTFKDEFDDFFAQVLYLFCNHRKIILENYINGRVFFMPPSVNPGIQEPHIDMTPSNPNIPKSEYFSHLVMLYYINDSDGDTVFFKDDKKTIMKTVEPKKGRIAFFDGSIWHAGSRPEKNHRFVFNTNFTGYNY